jgi:hypothetical protein
MPTLQTIPNTITLIPLVSIEEIIESRVPKTVTRSFPRRLPLNSKSPSRSIERTSHICQSPHLSNAHDSPRPPSSAQLWPSKLSPRRPPKKPPINSPPKTPKIAMKIAKKWTAKSRVFTAADAKKKTASKQDVLNQQERSPCH